MNPRIITLLRVTSVACNATVFTFFLFMWYRKDPTPFFALMWPPMLLLFQEIGNHQTQQWRKIAKMWEEIALRSKHD